MMFGKRKVRMLLAATALVTTTVPVVVTAVSPAGPAGAVGTTHSVTLHGVNNLVGSYEPKAKIQVSCSSNTGTMVVHVTGISIIGEDHVTQWQWYSPQIHIYVIGVGMGMGNSSLDLILSQNANTGWFDASASGPLSSGSGNDCVKGTIVGVNSISPGGLSLGGSLH